MWSQYLVSPDRICLTFFYFLLRAVAAALILERVVLGSSIWQALKWAAEPGNVSVRARRAVLHVLRAKHRSHKGAIFFIFIFSFGRFGVRWCVLS